MKKLLKTFVLILGAVLLTTGCVGNATTKSMNNMNVDVQSNMQSEVQIIKAGTGGFPKPYVFVKEDGELTGYDIEVLRTVFDRLPQYELELEITDFASVFAGLTSGFYDIGVNHFTYNEERGESYLYSYPYDKSESVFVTRNGMEAITSFATAVGKVYQGQVGISDTIAIEKWNEENPEQIIEIHYIDGDTGLILQNIENGSVDFTLQNRAMYQAYLEEYPYDLQVRDVLEEDKQLISANLNAYFIFPKDKEELRNEVNEVLREMRVDGTLTEIGVKWFGRDAAPDIAEYEETIN